MEYKFNEKSHLHQLEVDGKWKSLTGCTTILSVVAKPALIQWAANMAVDYIEKNSERQKDNGHYLTTIETLLEARKAHCRKKEKAGDWGKKTHAEIERFIKNRIAIDGNAIDITKYDESISKFIKWSEDNKVKFLESEKNIYSEKLWLGGIVDFICEIDGKIWVGDIKTSGSGIYPEHFWQCAGYDLMLKEMGLYLNVAGYLILNIKESGEFLEKRSVLNEDNIKAFMACLDIYRIKEKITNQVL